MQVVTYFPYRCTKSGAEGFKTPLKALTLYRRYICQANDISNVISSQEFQQPWQQPTPLQRAGALAPDEGLRYWDAGLLCPHEELPYSDAGLPCQDEGLPYPNAGLPYRGAGLSHREAGLPYPNAALRHPAAASAYLNAGLKCPDEGPP